MSSLMNDVVIFLSSLIRISITSLNREVGHAGLATIGLNVMSLGRYIILCIIFDLYLFRV